MGNLIVSKSLTGKFFYLDQKFFHGFAPDERIVVCLSFQLVPYNKHFAVFRLAQVLQMTGVVKIGSVKSARKMLS